ncbi:Single-stranded DNA-binding protein [Vibrio thalassae]|uniref:Single-stranded DNA-binding protein n=1 Tax=Vibrio thalassae TaxID=1243014 RepID=A0A240EEZ9_9VIBR|nr:single-stranded DNA-binding protein [Vibrio thalassae]SNX47262.1 Single-stranded DNA-binding protein [Vibrio thalassae]
MSSLSKTILIGNLCDQPEMVGQNGDVVRFTVATNESWRDKSTGEQKKSVEYHRVVIFGQPALYASQYFQKGRQVYIEGQNKTRKWTDNNGVDRYTTEVVVSKFEHKVMLLGNKQADQEQLGPI